MSPRIKPLAIVLATALLAAAGTVGARSSDRNQTMNIEAGYSSCGLGDNATCTLTGNVTIDQGSLHVVAAKAVMSQLNGDPSRVQLSGGVTLKQQLDDGSIINASATEVDYNLKTEIVTFVGNVDIRNQRGSTTGQRVVYNMKSGQIEGGGAGNGRIKMTLKPKSAQAQPAPKDSN